MFKVTPYILIFTLSTAGLCLPPAQAQSAAAQRGRRTADPNLMYRAPNTMHGKTVLIPIGTTWEGRIDTTISSLRSHPGQAFSIILSSPVLLNGVDVIVPAGSHVMGEVVEAISADRVPHDKHEPKQLIRGKLRVQLSGLRTPDGVTYPLVASLSGEVAGRGGGRGTPLGTGVAYVGSSASFEAVAPGMADRARYRPGTAPRVTSRRDLLKDQLLGMGDERVKVDDSSIRSLVLNHRDYFIYEGSPLTVKLNAPFKIGMTPPGMGVPITPVTDELPAEDSLPPPSRKTEESAPAGSYPFTGTQGMDGPAPQAQAPSPAPGQAVPGPLPESAF